MELKVTMFTSRSLLSTFLICLLILGPISADKPPKDNMWPPTDKEWCHGGCYHPSSCNIACKGFNFKSGDCNAEMTICCCHPKSS
ncbi:hypothetical protein FRX31_033565 [Thalictrum thalictroides]|uniref:Defensin-like protein n=1 Tax=Thalictrum thalictroides TaxID=46969 RepID=A0A7J6UWN1_THATH|nr:hypothetical protein FRX31_033565 [Thalictrum thalictroides]